MSNVTGDVYSCHVVPLSKLNSVFATPDKLSVPVNVTVTGFTYEPLGPSGAPGSIAYDVTGAITSGMTVTV
ncbi:hypothetical protein D3C85_1873250 [compost metagenome]